MRQNENPTFNRENSLEKSSVDRLNDPKIVSVFLNRHGKHERTFPGDENFKPESSGKITVEGRREIKKEYTDFFEKIIAETDDDLPLDIMVGHSPTKWYDAYGERATETVDIFIEVAKEILQKTNRDIQILSDLGIKIRKGILARRTEDHEELEPKRDTNVPENDKKLSDYRQTRDAILAESQQVAPSKGDKIAITRLREADIFWPYKVHQGDLGANQEEYVKALEGKYGDKYWEKYYEGESEFEEIRKKVGAESAKDVANRALVIFRGLSMYQNLKHGKENPDRKLVVCMITHSDVLSSFMKQGVDVEDKEDWVDFGNNKGVRVDISDKESKVLASSGKEYFLKLEKK